MDYTNLIRVRVTRSEKGLGIDLVIRDGKVFYIRGMWKEGDIIDWNREHKDAIVSIGDRIVQVNRRSIKGAMELLAEIRRSKELVLTIATGGRGRSAADGFQ